MMDATAAEDEKESVIELPPGIRLKWSPWYKWGDIKSDARSSGISIPSGERGVYEARHEHEPSRLTIGKASDLRQRIRQGLVKGKIPHSSGARIRGAENTETILVRWAETDRPAAVEEELHRQHRQRYGRLPKYTSHT